MAVWNSTVQSQCEDAEKAWKSLLVHLKFQEKIVPNRKVKKGSNFSYHGSDPKNHLFFIGLFLTSAIV